MRIYYRWDDRSKKQNRKQTKKEVPVTLNVSSSQLTYDFKYFYSTLSAGGGGGGGGREVTDPHPWRVWGMKPGHARPECFASVKKIVLFFFYVLLHVFSPLCSE